MAKKSQNSFVSALRVTPGRVISAQDIQEMAETFDPRVYGCRINRNICAASCLTAFLNVMAMWPN
ncbi:hypothetical protein [Escherichia coli]|uniref:hypothetical protein n=1 Tax=Escherichia coli TaxID=562 RepID=UPI001A16DD1C|nr:hypothetical protein ECZU31_17630 [Escherichia coli]